MHGYSTDPGELAEAAKTLDDAADEVSAAGAELADGAGPGLGPAGIDDAADALLREQHDAVRAVGEDLRASATAAREVSERYVRLEDDVIEHAREIERE